MSVKELISSKFYPELYVNIQCTEVNTNDTMILCYPYTDLMYCLNEDSLTKHLCGKMEDYILRGEVLELPVAHFLLKKAIKPDASVDSVYALGGYNQILSKYFFCHDELNKEKSCCLDWLHSACGNSVYFGHYSTPCYYRDGDNYMNYNKQYYIISLLYKNHIYCSDDQNGNVCLLNYNLKKEDFIHIPFPIVEIR